MESMRTEGGRDEEAVRRFVEHFAMTFADLGFPRMPARVLGTLMAADEPGLTAGEIGDRLGVSAAAISGAVRYLAHIGLIVREPVPGSRRDIYRMPNDTWYVASMVKSGAYQKIADVVSEGAKVVGDETTAPGQRIGEMRDFFHFMQDEMAQLLERWEEQRQRGVRA
jgi:DNA-binding transcriptional regulator GbsR (MarR family)